MAAEIDAVDLCLAVPATLSWTGILRYHIGPAPPTPLSRGGPDACHAFSMGVYIGHEGRALITMAIY